MNNENMNDYWKSEWALLSVSYSQLRNENINLKKKNTYLNKKYCDLKLKYETLIYKLDLQNKEKSL